MLRPEKPLWYCMQIPPLVTPIQSLFKLTLGDTFQPIYSQIYKYFLSIFLALIKIVITVCRHLYSTEQMFVHIW